MCLANTNSLFESHLSLKGENLHIKNGLRDAFGFVLFCVFQSLTQVQQNVTPHPILPQLAIILNVPECNERSQTLYLGHKRLLAWLSDTRGLMYKRLPAFNTYSPTYVLLPMSIYVNELYMLESVIL